MVNLKTINVGSFENKSGDFIISDPCYDLGSIGQSKLTNILEGTWHGFIKKAEGRCFELVAKHDSVKHQNNFDWNHSSIIAVDSGQAGIFDSKVYRNNDTVVNTPKTFIPNDWYSSCCDQTMITKLGGVIPGGVVSQSGYGDGDYDFYYSSNKDSKINAIKIVFIEVEEFTKECNY